MPQLVAARKLLGAKRTLGFDLWEFAPEITVTGRVLPRPRVDNPEFSWCLATSGDQSNVEVCSNGLVGWLKAMLFTEIESSRVIRPWKSLLTQVNWQQLGGSEASGRRQ